MKYYFITYQGQRRDNDPSISIWHDVTSKSPMEFRESHLKAEATTESKSHYRDFYILTTTEISKEDYDKYRDTF